MSSYYIHGTAHFPRSDLSGGGEQDGRREDGGKQASVSNGVEGGGGLRWLVWRPGVEP